MMALLVTTTVVQQANGLTYGSPGQRPGGGITHKPKPQRGGPGRESIPHVFFVE